MKYIYFSILVIFSLSIKPNAYAENANTITALEFQNRCISKDDINQAYCYGMINGSISMLSLTLISGAIPNNKCQIPRNWTTEQGKEIFLKWIKDHPEDLQLHPSTILLSSHINAFCGIQK